MPLITIHDQTTTGNTTHELTLDILSVREDQFLSKDS